MRALRQGPMAAHCPNHSDGAAYPSHMWVSVVRAHGLADALGVSLAHVGERIAGRLLRYRRTGLRGSCHLRRTGCDAVAASWIV
jgi:hypothetical protein